MFTKEMRKLMESIGSIEIVEEVPAVSRLDEIKDEIKELMREASSILQQGDERTWARAKSYWYAHIISALDSEHGYMGGSMVTMQDTIDEMRGSEGGVESAVQKVVELIEDGGLSIEDAVGQVADETGLNYNELMAVAQKAMGY